MPVLEMRIGKKLNDQVTQKETAPVKAGAVASWYSSKSVARAERVHFAELDQQVEEQVGLGPVT